MRTFNRNHDPTDNSEAHLHQQLAELDAIEHDAYALSHGIDFTSNHAQVKAQAGAVSTLLDDVQREHKALIARTVQHKRKLWVHGATTPAERTTIDANWNALVAGKGAFDVSDETNDAQGRKVRIPQAARNDMHTEILASSARLMSRPHGRRLVTRLREGASDSYALTRALGYGYNRPVGFEVENLHRLQLGGANSLNYRAFEAGQTSRPVDTHGAVARGIGSASLVKVSPGIQDSTLLDEGAAGRRIVSPSFVGFGHELVHAARYQRGAYIPGAHAAANLPASYHNDIEEFMTIASTADRNAVQHNVVPVPIANPGGGQHNVNATMAQIAALSGDLPSEADLRAEHGLEVRSGHGAPIANPVKHPGGINAVTETQAWEAANVGAHAVPVQPGALRWLARKLRLA
ncbi:MAG TPA: hypothetical protein VHT53_13250 [Candidatus Elarobacter sp.]|nr:hypothetical protein [Candidatus Elarobacter sp.]